MSQATPRATDKGAAAAQGRDRTRDHDLIITSLSGAQRRRYQLYRRDTPAISVRPAHSAGFKLKLPAAGPEPGVEISPRTGTGDNLGRGVRVGGPGRGGGCGRLRRTVTTVSSRL